MPSAVLTLLLVFAAIASAMFWPALYGNALRKLFRTWPDARDSFVGRGSWISFSRRFGKTYALAALATAFVWMLLGARFVPDTIVGAWLLFAPAILLIVVSVFLTALVVCRWVVDE
jgi:hypothetical protein